MSPPAHDARAVANLLLDRADAKSLFVSHIALQKLLYFAHGQHLVSFEVPLVDGVFEAWKFGPVHPVVYGAFREAGPNAIVGRAHRRDLIARTQLLCAPPTDKRAIATIDRILDTLGGLSARRLVDLSHASKGPWSRVVDKAGTATSLGMRIPDTVTVECFRYHWVTQNLSSPLGEPSEDAPLT